MAILLPQPLYPKFLDSDYTLYNVTNTAETVLSKNLEPWAKNIFVTPVTNKKQEIWKDNGFITINGELIYYDAVSKDTNTGKVIALRNCIRNVDGRKPKFAAAGTYVRGFVVAQHHNQLARALVNIENILSVTNSKEKDSLSWKIKYLNDQIYSGDDSSCPQVSFTYDIISEPTAECITIRFNTIIKGNYKSQTIYFGDGTSDSVNLSGTHTYAPNQKVDPYVEINGYICDCIGTNPKRIEGLEPEFNPDALINIPSGGSYTDNNPATISTTWQGDLGGGGIIPDDFIKRSGDNPTIGGGGDGDSVPTIDDGTNIISDGGDGGGGSGGAGGGGGGSAGGGGSGPLIVTPLYIPEIPCFPNLRFSLANQIDNQTQLPPIVFPTLDIGPFGPINIPSQISLIQTAFIPSQINFFQTDVIPSIIQFNNIPPIPSLISIFAVEKIPEQIVIEPSTLEMLNTQYSVNCTESITLNNTTDSTEKYETLTESDTCDTPGGQNDKYGGPDTNKIQKVQVVVHDFYVKSPTSMHPRYDAIKILIEDPTDANGFTRKCLVMGSGFPQYNENNIPKYDIKDPVTLTFDDKGKRNFYNFNVPLTSATYGTASNGNSLKRNSGLANLALPAPNPPYSSFLGVFADRKIGLGKWKAYVVVGKGPPSPLPTPKPTETPQPTLPATSQTPLPTRTPRPTPEPFVPNKIPETIVSIGKICVRIFYYEQLCPLGTTTPTPTAGTPTPEPWPTFPPYPTFPACVIACEPTCAACTPTPTATVTPTPTKTATPTPTPSPTPTPTITPSPSVTPFIGSCEFACFDGFYRLNGSPDDCPSCDEYPEILKPCKDSDIDYLYLPCPHL
jgi:uncharacterized membrane protein YgcG